MLVYRLGQREKVGCGLRSSQGFCLMYTRVRFLVRRYLAQFPQGRKAARVSELFRVREGPFSFSVGWSAISQLQPTPGPRREDGPREARRQWEQ